MGVFKRGNCWYARIRDRGTLIKKSAGRSKRKAEQLDAKMKAERLRRRELGLKVPTKQTLAEFLDEQYIPELKERMSHYAAEQGRVRRIKAILGHMPLAEVGPHDIKLFIASLKGRRPATKNRYLERIKNMFRTAMDHELIHKNPARTIKKRPEKNEKPRDRTKEEVLRLIRCVPEDYQPMVITGGWAGLRRSEMDRLQLPDLDFSKNMVWVRPSKNGEGRWVPMNRHVREALLAIKHRGLDDPHVFRRGDGSRIKNFDKAWKKARQEAGMVGFRFHDLRHCFASWLIQSGVGEETIMRLMGHKTRSMVRRYAHLRRRDLRDAVNVLDRQNVGIPKVSQLD